MTRRIRWRTGLTFCTGDRKEIGRARTYIAVTCGGDACGSVGHSAGDSASASFVMSVIGTWRYDKGYLFDLSSHKRRERPYYAFAWSRSNSLGEWFAETQGAQHGATSVFGPRFPRIQLDVRSIADQMFCLAF